ncbi:MAG: hypothetical protein IJX89_01195 [Alphaproteobacteria bacterium]|nr:hypothetical protein [Alphaproteobacteria bacterium]
MKLKLWIFICVLYPCFAFATMDSDAYSVPANSKWTEIAVDKLDGMWGKSFDIVEYKMKQIAPHIVDMISNENEVVRARMYKNYLAQQAAKFAMDAAIEDMHMSSQQTSRAIKTYNKDKQIITVTKLVPGADGVYWLDRGALDSTECLVGDTGYYRCIYPNDYREKMLIISNGGFGITVEEDIDVNNKLYHVYH